MSRSLTRTIKSVLSAFIGVQNNKNREEDFKQGKFSHFVVVALIILFLFILLLMGIVNWILP